jgi:hypothetical protein
MVGRCCVWRAEPPRTVARGVAWPTQLAR